MIIKKEGRKTIYIVEPVKKDKPETINKYNKTNKKESIKEVDNVR